MASEQQSAYAYSDSSPVLGKRLRWTTTEDWDERVAEWITEPNIAIINSIASRYLAHGPVHAEFITGGCFNKIYRLIDANGSSDYIFRISLPVDPFFKTSSEVATIDFLQQHTSIPLPNIVAHDAFMDNELGFEWMIQRFVPGTKLSDVWDDLSLEQKMLLGKEIIGYIQELRNHTFDEIGNLYLKSDLESYYVKKGVIRRSTDQRYAAA